MRKGQIQSEDDCVSKRRKVTNGKAKRVLKRERKREREREREKERERERV